MTKQSSTELAKQAVEPQITSPLHIFCMNCGKELPGDANFCLKCGKPTSGASVSQPKAEVVMETCDLSIEHSGYNAFLSPKYTIIAQAVGPYGRRTLYGGDPGMGNKGIYGQGPEFAISKDADPNAEWVGNHGSSARQALDSLIKALTDDGWQPVGRGAYWHSYRFQRQFSAERETNDKINRRYNEAIKLIVHLREKNIRLTRTSLGELEYGGPKISKDDNAKVADLKKELLDLLRPDNDRGAAFILLAWLHAGKVEFEATSSGDLRVVRGKLSKESQAEAARLKPHLVEILKKA
jgi:hypothetical protein